MPYLRATKRMTNGKMTIREIITNTTKLLKNAGIESANLDCRLLLCKFLNKDRLYLAVNSEKEVEINEEFDKLVQRRANHEPMQYILEHAEFMGLDFYVNKSVLIPRPDTEILVEKAIEFIGENKSVFLDIGTGSGCISVSILANCKNSSAYAADISENALKIAAKNAESYAVSDRLTLINTDIMHDFPETEVDCIVSNPPYIESSEIPYLMKDVRDFEPKTALDGGADGLDFYRRIADKGYGLLKEGGMIAFETGYRQAQSVMSILEKKGYKNSSVTKDLSGNDRVVTAYKHIK